MPFAMLTSANMHTYIHTKRSIMIITISEGFYSKTDLLDDPVDVDGTSGNSDGLPSEGSGDP